MLRHIITAAALIASATGTAQASTPSGVWANPAKSVHVTFKPCGKAICGTVIWASAKAKADVARGSGGQLVGSTLFDHFVEDGRGRWRGEVLVPDIGQRVSGTITLVDPRTLIGEGCLFAGLGCKSQTWTRIK